MFTQSGAIKVDGVEHAIRDTGLSINQMGVGGEKTRTLVPMRDRVVRLEKLGQGATGSVYKALDLQTLQLVALKGEWLEGVLPRLPSTSVDFLLLPDPPSVSCPCLDARLTLCDTSFRRLLLPPTASQCLQPI